MQRVRRRPPRGTPVAESGIANAACKLRPSYSLALPTHTFCPTFATARSRTCRNPTAASTLSTATLSSFFAVVAHGRAPTPPLCVPKWAPTNHHHNSLLNCSLWTWCLSNSGTKKNPQISNIAKAMSFPVWRAARPCAARGVKNPFPPSQPWPPSPLSGSSLDSATHRRRTQKSLCASVYTISIAASMRKTDLGVHRGIQHQRVLPYRKLRNGRHHACRRRSGAHTNARREGIETSPRCGKAVASTRPGLNTTDERGGVSSSSLWRRRGPVSSRRHGRPSWWTSTTGPPGATSTPAGGQTGAAGG